MSLQNPDEGLTSRYEVTVEDGMERGASLSPDGLYRYSLHRRWGGARTVLWVMLNPSTADAYVDDRTISRCIGYSRAWGYEQLRVVNLYALRTTKPEHLEHHPDPVGPMQMAEWHLAVQGAELAVLAWGEHKVPRTSWGDMRKPVTTLLQAHSIPTKALGITKGGDPRHPLYLKNGLQPLPYDYLQRLQAVTT